MPPAARDRPLVQWNREMHPSARRAGARLRTPAVRHWRAASGLPRRPLRA